MKKNILICLIISLLMIANIAFAQQKAEQIVKMPASLDETMQEPVKYTGNLTPNKYYNDGLLPHAAGVHHFQVFRANRSHPPENGEGEAQGWTYNHQPYLAYHNQKFYYQYLSNRYHEHGTPGRTLLMMSDDGLHYSDPIVLFPQYDLPEIKHDDYVIPAGTKSVMHQRMGFYIAPNGRLLTSGFYSFCASTRHSPNAGNGIGRVIREIYPDGTFGPIYFIRYNRHAGWNEKNTNFPFYKKSKDKGFLEACESLLSDKLITLQWWEEDRAEDGFYTINPGDVENADYFSANIVTSRGAGKAFCFYKRPDGVLVGLWKNQYAALSPDNGNSWTKISQNPTLLTSGAKTWGQRTDDGRYAIVHNQSATMRNRFPMAVLVSDDGHIFEHMYCLSGEVPPKRFQGCHKNPGLQYFRGIFSGNGNPPGDHMWIVHSMNKEDLWIARVEVPIVGAATKHVDQNFDNINAVTDLSLWNLYVPQWAPVSLAYDPVGRSKCLELKDEDPYDYAKVERILPDSRELDVQFRLNPKVVSRGYALEIEVQDQRGKRPMRLRIDENTLGVDHRDIEEKLVPFETRKWHLIRLVMSCEKQSYDLYVDGAKVHSDLKFQDDVSVLQRLVFRTGPYRNYVTSGVIDGQPNCTGILTEDRPGADEKVSICVYWIDDLKTKGE